MKKPRFEDLSDEEQDWIDALLDETISDESFARLQDRMLERPELREVVRRSLALHHDLQDRAVDDADVTKPWLAAEKEPTNVIPFASKNRERHHFPISLAAGLAFLLGVASMYFGRQPEVIEQTASPPAQTDPPEAEASGFAVLARLFDAEWSAEEPERRPGDNLGAEVLKLRSGVAEIQFFSGAAMVVQGPAEITLKSAWEATCREGSVRMRVPPAARGFRLNGPATEIVDLGTEFGFEARDGKAHVEVLDGEISFRHRDGDKRIAKRGSAWLLPGDGDESVAETGRLQFPELGSYSVLAQSRLRKDFARWLTYSRELARDPRMIAYYTFQRAHPAAVVASLAEPRSSEFDGAVVLAETAAGRWPGMKQALEFRRPGARVRVRIPGEFSAFTFAAWVRIDSLDRRYNALFMGDGYETGEPHWQIRDDGKLMLSVMVDDSRPNPHNPDDAGFHRVYFSPPIWDRSMSGQWLHLVSVFDPKNREVLHYVDGKRISRQEIIDEYLIHSLRIGNGEIGNWGEPFRETPWFAIRNLNGRIDELAILNAALTAEEITKFHTSSRANHQ